MPGVAANKIAFPRRFRRLFVPGLLVVLIVALMLRGDTSAAGSAAREGFVLAGGCQHAFAPPLPPSLADQPDTFVRTLAEAIKLSGLAAVAPPILPRGTVIQGYDVPRESGIHVVVVDITQDCDLYAPRVMQIRESDVNPSFPPAISVTAKRLTINGRPVGSFSSNQGGAYFWDGQELSYWLTVPSYAAVPPKQVEQLIAAMPGSFWYKPRLNCQSLALRAR